MIEFYYKFWGDKFETKVVELIKELERVLILENINILESDNIVIEEKFRDNLAKETFHKINNLFYTIQASGLSNHLLLKKYFSKKQQKTSSKSPLFADFFSGAGGLSQGLINAGFQPAFINDHYITAIETHYFNHSLPLDRYFGGDIQDLIKNYNLYESFFKNVKVVAGGPPCQGFSRANRQPLLEDPRNILYKDFILLLQFIQPDFFIMENVPGMRKKIVEIEKDITGITGSDYRYTELILNAKDFGIPQNRDRYFLIGNKVGYSNLKLEMDILVQRNTKQYVLKDALFGLPPLGTNPFRQKTSYESVENGYMITKRHLEKNEFIQGINKGYEGDYLFNHKSRYNQLRDIEIFKNLPEGGDSLHESIRDLMPYKSRDGIFKDKYFKLEQNRVSKTITSHMRMDCNSYIHPTQARGISPREAARIQTFPDDYVFRGSPNEWYHQIGNAVPVKLAEIIGKEIMKFYV